MITSTYYGGGSGIRTRDTVSRIHTFQACAFNRSATSPIPLIARPARIASVGGASKPGFSKPLREQRGFGFVKKPCGRGGEAVQAAISIYRADVAGLRLCRRGHR